MDDARVDPLARTGAGGPHRLYAAEAVAWPTTDSADDRLAEANRAASEHTRRTGEPTVVDPDGSWMPLRGRARSDGGGRPRWLLGAAGDRPGASTPPLDER